MIATVGTAPRPVFARAREKAPRARSPLQMALGFATVAVVLAAVVSAASGLLAELASGGRISLSTPLVAAFSALLVVQAAKYPLGMYMTDARGLRYQAVMVVAMLPVNVAISVLLARELGAVGPVVGSVVGVLVFQVLANWYFVTRDRRTSRPVHR